MTKLIFIATLTLIALGLGVYFIIFPKDKEVEVSRTVQLFYYNETKDQDSAGNVQCGEQGLVAVKREIPITQTPIQDTIRLLLKGNVSEKERTEGVTTQYPLEGVSLVGASLHEEVLTLEFDDPQNKTSGGSCRVTILRSQIEATAKQFPDIKSVTFIPEELFQP